MQYYLIIFDILGGGRHDPHHQALLLVRGKEAALFDGICPSPLAEAAKTAWESVKKYINPEVAEPVLVKTGKQYDAWSSGHRVITTLRLFFFGSIPQLGALDQGHMVVARLGCNPLGDYGGEQLASLGPEV